MKILSRLSLLILSTFAFADEYQFDTSHLLSEAHTKQALVQRLQKADVTVTENQQKYDAAFYDLNLFPDVETRILYGDVSMTARVLENGLDMAELDLLDNIDVDSVFVDGMPASFSHADNLLSINFAAPLTAGDTFTTRVVYHGTPAQTGFGAFGFDSHAGKPMVWTLSEPYGARNWWPCKDAPVDKADSVDINVKVRSDLIVASNGLLNRVTESDGFKTFHWQERYPIVTYLVSLAIHPYATYSDWYINDQNDSMEVQFYMFASSVAGAKENNAKTVDMIAAFSDIFGEYPFIDEKYGHAQFVWGGGMEHQTISSMGGFSESLIAHELAHQWWGDMVTCEDFHHIWLNEGFATYSEALWWESQYGESALHQDMARKAYKGPGSIYIENPLTDNIFVYSTTYAKAAWVLHMLRHVMGDEVFFDLLKIYYEEFKFKTITTEQFRDLCERVSGKELGAFFDQWIYKEGVPSYEFLWWSEEISATDWRVKGIVRQTQLSPVFDMPIDITITTDSGSETFVIQNSERTQEFEFMVTSAPQSVQFDKDNWILKHIDQISAPVFIVQQVSLADENDAAATSFDAGAVGRIYVDIQNLGLAATDVAVTMTSESDAVQLTIDKIDIGSVGPSEHIANTGQPFIFNVADDANDHLAFLQFRVDYDGGSSEAYRFSIPIGSPTLLLVDDDAGADYEKYYEKIALQSSQFSAVWSVETQGVPSLEELQKVQHVLWFTGDDSLSTLTTDEQIVITNYLAAGGKLLLSGQSIGFDLVEDGDDVDAAFYRDILHAEYSPDILTDEAVVGQPGDVVGNRLTLRFNDMFAGAGNQRRLRSLDPIIPAVTSFLYLPSQARAGLRYEDAVTGCKLVYLGFGLEGVEGPKETSAAELLSQVITWFSPHTHSNDSNGNTLPNQFVLEQNFPNPFNPDTKVRFYNPERTNVSVIIYNALGQKIRTLHNETLNAGWHLMSWDGLTDDGIESASGVYFFQIRQKNENKFAPKSVKMLKLN